MSVKIMENRKILSKRFQQKQHVPWEECFSLLLVRKAASHRRAFLLFTKSDWQAGTSPSVAYLVATAQGKAGKGRAEAPPGMVLLSEQEEANVSPSAGSFTTS